MTSQRLHGKTALVTGAAAGIGRALAVRFAAEGARVIVSDRDLHGAETASAEIPRSRALALDITNETSVAAAFDALERTGWSPDVVVANAGVQLFGRDARIADLELAAWQQTLDVNLTGTFLTLRHAVRSMLPRQSGSIIVIGSPTAVNGEGADFTAYSASKAGMHGMTRAVAAAYARDGIRANILVPAYTETGLVAAISGDAESRAAIISRIPLGRAGTPDDIAGMAVFLASDESVFATGATFPVDGGMTTL